MPRRPALLLATAGYLALIAWATLGPVAWGRIGWEAPGGVLNPSIWADPATWSVGSSIEFAANIAMFIPLGVLLGALAGPRGWWLAVGGAIAVSVAIELVQIPIDDRISDPRDLVANSLGAVVGVAIAAIGWLWVAAVRNASGPAVAAEPEVGVPGAPEPALPEPALSRTAR